MCGILGIYNKKTDKAFFEKCLQRLNHRGPDGFGIWSEGGVMLGHTRLAILDLSESGKQPMLYGRGDNETTGNYVITFNGEIYNFLEIRAELESKGYSFYTDTDTEVILASFIEWGENCVNHFNGMWAFGIYNRISGKLFLSRDRFGVKPLFYTVLCSNSGEYSIAFASEIKALLPMIDNPELNEEVANDIHSVWKLEGSEETLFSQIKKIPAGHNAFVSLAGITINRYWNTLDNIPVIPAGWEERVEFFRELFTDAVKLRMRSDVPIGTALSGGIDSSAVISTIAHISNNSSFNIRNANNDRKRESNSWQHAFVASFPGTSLDETEYAKAVTDHIGIDSTFIDMNKACNVEYLPEQQYLLEEIFTTAPMPMMRLYGEMRNQGVLVSIDGHGADELFAGYTSDFYHALLDAGLNKEERNSIKTALEGSLGKMSRSSFISQSAKMFIKYYGKSILGYNPIDKADASHPMFKEMDHLDKILYRSFTYGILPVMMKNYDRLSMANGVEIRMPFMDHRIVTSAFAMDWSSKIKNGYSKAIVRYAMAPYMPDKVTWRTSKIGFSTPLAEWMKSELGSFMKDEINSLDFANSEVVKNKKKVSNYINNIIEKEKISNSEGIKAYSMFAPYLWEKYYYKRAVRI